jgi:L-cysteine desulfidase
MQLDISDELKNNFLEEYSKLENSYNTSMYSDDLSNILLKCTSATYARMS